MPENTGRSNNLKSVVCHVDEMLGTTEWRPNIPTCISKNIQMILYKIYQKM